MALIDALGLVDDNDLNDNQKANAVATPNIRLPVNKTSLSMPCFSSQFFPVRNKAFNRINKIMIDRHCLNLFFIFGEICILYTVCDEFKRMIKDKKRKNKQGGCPGYRF